MNTGTNSNKFLVKDCFLPAIATGERANSLSELRDKLATIEEGSIYYHFWGARMNPQFIHAHNHNDFAAWVFHHLHDLVLAEQLSVIDPIEFENLEALRQELLETIDRRLDIYENLHLARKEDRFHFITSAIIVFESTLAISTPEELPKMFPKMPPGSVFYHFIDARSRTAEKQDDFSIWLKIFGEKYANLIESIQAIDPYFLSLTEVRDELTNASSKYFEGRKDHV